MGFLDDLLDAGTVFDWVSPVMAMGQDVANGPSHTFMVPQSCGLSGGDITKRLRSRGIKTWGHMVVNGQIMFTVKKKHENHARSMLRGMGL